MKLGEQALYGAAFGKIAKVIGTPIFNAAGKVIGKVTPQFLQDIVAKGGKELTDFAGGLDAFAAKAGAFVSTYYSQGEQAGIGAKAVLDQLAALGIDGSTMQSLADMRTLVEAQQINDTTGREQLAGLLDVAQNYASVGKVLEEQKLTLAELAAQAPQVAVLEAMRTPTEVTADATVRTATAAEAQIDRLTALQQSVEAGLAAATAATDRLTSIMSAWDNGGAMSVVVEPA